MKSWLWLVAILFVGGCSMPQVIPPTTLRFTGERVAFIPSSCRTMNARYLDIARSVVRQRLIDTDATVAVLRSEPRTLNVDLCVSFVPNGSVPYGGGYAEIFMAQVWIRAVDASGSVRDRGQAQTEYRTSGRQGFECGAIEVWRTGGLRADHSGPRTVLREKISSTIRPCPVSPEEAFVFAAEDAFNAMKKY